MPEIEDPTGSRLERWLIGLALRAWPRGAREQVESGIRQAVRDRRAASGGDRAGLGLGLEVWDVARAGVRARLEERRRRRAAAGADTRMGNGRGGAMGAKVRAMTGTMMNVLRHAARSVRRSPAWGLMVAGVVGVGVCATVSIFAVVDVVALRPLPYPDADALVRIGVEREGRPGLGTISHPNFLDFEAAARSLESVAAFTPLRMGARTGETAELIRGGWVTGDFFATLGIGAASGRTLDRTDDDAAAPLAVVVSHGLAQRRFAGASPVGASIEIDGASGTIIGVMPASFVPPEGARMADTEAWAPMAHAPLPTEERGLAFLDMLGRRAPGASDVAVRAELASIGGSLIEAHSLDPRAFSGMVSSSLREATVGDIGPTLLVLLASVGLLLGIAVLNASNLILLRALRRVDALRVRVSLGATRARVLAESVAESAMLALGGGLAGIGLAVWAVEEVVASRPVSMPRLVEAQVDLRVAAVGVGVSLLAGVAAGLVPALAALRSAPAGRVGRGRASDGRGVRRLRDGVVVAQVALGLALACTATLLARGMGEMRRVPIGLEAENLHVATLRIDGIGGDDFDATVLPALVDAARAQPGVLNAGLGSGSPYTPGGWVGYLDPEGIEVTDEQRVQGRVELHRSGPAPLSLLGIRLIRGRDLTPADREDTEPVVVISESVARAWWGDADPLGRLVVVGGDGTFAQRRVVGIADTPRFRGPTGDAEQHLWLPWQQMPAQPLDLRLRTDGTTSAERAVTAAAAAVPGVELRGVRSIQAELARTYVESTFFAVLFALFAASATLFAAVGLYATLAQNVRARRLELGIRVALGADARRLAWSVMRYGVLLTGVGLLLGAGLASAGVRLAAPLLFGVEPGDLRAWVAALVILTVGGAVASGIPAWRASRADPTESLRME